MDSVLKEIASILTQSIRKEDVAAHHEGEEFVLLLSHCDISNAAIIAEKIRKSIENLSPSNLSVTASFGVAEISQDSIEGFPELSKAANQAVCQAKTCGGNTVVAHDN